MDCPFNDKEWLQSGKLAKVLRPITGMYGELPAKVCLPDIEV
jgi:hypothetical protein